ncbi:hypothetical protein EYC59_04740 [Candidatus Saccharibacteria bacterium]|nr:MAG: hypothetical protein EYC59_04740 [Candidatus Saccharibacteria bacterium]
MKKPVVLTVVGGVALLLVGVLWWTFVRSSPTTAFNDMLSNNLSTPGVTRVLEQKSGQLQIAQYTQLQLGAQPTAHALTTLTQQGGVIATEQISTQQNDYVRYQKIVATAKTADGKPVDVSSVVGKWAKMEKGSSLGSSVTAGLFNQTLFGIMPIANLEPAARKDLLHYINANDVFTYDPAKVKTMSLQGRKAYSYEVSIKPAPYIKMMQEFGKLVGIHQYDDINANNYATSASIPVTIVVDARSHALAEVDQSATGRTERYTGFGLMPQTEVPKATLTTKQLTEQLGKLQQTSTAN